MASSASSEACTVFACAIEKQIVQDFKRKAKELVNDVVIAITSYTCSRKQNWCLAQLTVQSSEEAVKLVVKLRGLKLGRSNVGLKFYWPVEMKYSERARLNKIVETQMRQLHCFANGGFYDKTIEDIKGFIFRNTTMKKNKLIPTNIIISNLPTSMHKVELFHLVTQGGIVTSLKMIENSTACVTYIGQYDATVALLCLDKFEILEDQPIGVKFENSVKTVHLMDEVMRLRNLLKKKHGVTHSKPSKPNVNSTVSGCGKPQATERKNKMSPTSISRSVPQSQSRRSNQEGKKKSTEVNKPNADHGTCHLIDVGYEAFGCKGFNPTFIPLVDNIEEFRQQIEQNMLTKFNASLSHLDVIFNRYETAAKGPNPTLSTVNRSGRSTFECMDKGNIHASNELQPIVRKEYKFPWKTIFLIRHINLAHRLRNDGVTVSFIFTANDCNDKDKLIVETIPENEAYILDKLLNFMSVIDHCGHLSKRICQYLAHHDEIGDVINLKLQELNIDAGITYSDQSISVVAINSDDHDKVIAILQEAFVSVSTKFSIEGLSFTAQIIELLISDVKKSLPQSNCLWLEADLESEPSTCILTATGPRKLVMSATQMINNKQDDCKVLNVYISDVCILKTEYLRLYRKEDILALEKKCCCQIEIQAIKESDALTLKSRKAIKIKCYEVYKDEINRQMDEIIDGIIIEKADSISLYSRIGKYCGCYKSESKLKNWQEKFQCMLTLIDHQSHSDYYRRINSKLDSACINLKGTGVIADTKPIPLKPKVEDKSPLTKALLELAQYCRDQKKVNNVNIKIIKGSIEKEGANCDVIVNSTKFGSYRKGKIAAALYNVGLINYERECLLKLANLTIDNIGITSGRWFGCKSVYHISFLSSDRTLAWLSSRVKECLAQAERDNMNSIAIPTIGTGGIGLNANDVCQELVQVAMTFAQKKGRKNLKEIHFIVYPTDSNSYIAFQRALTGSSMEPHPHQGMVEILTKPADSGESNLKSDCQLLFKAQCDETVIPVKIQVYHGTVNDVKADAIIDVTALCLKHTTTDNHMDIATYTDVEHVSRTLRCLQLPKSSHTVYQICPYGCLAGFNTLLACINARGEKSVVFPLLDMEMNASDIDNLVDLIESFMLNHLTDDNSINCFNFVIGYQNRSIEVATWIQDKITNKALLLQWTILQQVSESVEDVGITAYYVASDKAAINNMKLSMMANSNTWARHELADEDYFKTIQPQFWYQLALKMWSLYNTIIIRSDTDSGVCIFGYETDIINTVSHIYELSKTHLQQKANKELQEFAAEVTQWYAMIGSNRSNFGIDLNYEIEKNYNIYANDKTKKIFYIDSDTKIINYEDMKITHIAKGIEGFIGKSTFEDIPIPDNWEFNNKEDIIDGYCSIIDVTNKQEIQEISKILNCSGLYLTKIQRVQNWNLYRRFQIMKAEVTEAVKAYMPSAQVERRLFHGTDSNNLKAICKSGFDRDYSGRGAGSSLGTGTYFAANARVSRGYGDSLLLARVLTGIYTQASSGGRPNLSIIQGSQSERVHSVVDNACNPSVFVISNDNSAYPEYILHVN